MRPPIWAFDWPSKSPRWSAKAMGPRVGVAAVPLGELIRGMPEAFAEMRRRPDLRSVESGVPGNHAKPAYWQE